MKSVPTIAVVIGEGGSGGALGVGVCDKLLILENAYYSVISPEGCAAILWKDRANAEQGIQPPDARLCFAAQERTQAHHQRDTCRVVIVGRRQAL